MTNLHWFVIAGILVALFSALGVKVLAMIGGVAW